MDDPKWKADFAKHSGKIDNLKNEMTEARFAITGYCATGLGVENSPHGFAKFILLPGRNRSGLIPVIPNCNW